MTRIVWEPAELRALGEHMDRSQTLGDMQKLREAQAAVLPANRHRQVLTQLMADAMLARIAAARATTVRTTTTKSITTVLPVGAVTAQVSPKDLTNTILITLDELDTFRKFQPLPGNTRLLIER